MMCNISSYSELFFNITFLIIIFSVSCIDSAPVYFIFLYCDPLPPSKTTLLIILFFVLLPCNAIVPHDWLLLFLNKIGFSFVPKAINLSLKMILDPFLIKN